MYHSKTVACYLLHDCGFYFQESMKGDHIWERNGDSETIMCIFLLFKRTKRGSAEFFLCIIMDKARAKWNTLIRASVSWETQTNSQTGLSGITGVFDRLSSGIFSQTRCAM